MAPKLWCREGQFLGLEETAKLLGMSCCVPTFSAAGLSVLRMMRRGSAEVGEDSGDSGVALGAVVELVFPGAQMGLEGSGRTGWHRYSRSKVLSSTELLEELRDMAVAQGSSQLRRTDRQISG